MADGATGESDLEFIQRCVLQGKLFWTYHSKMRLGERDVRSFAVRNSTARYEIIERRDPDPSSVRLPSCLVLTSHRRRRIHILFALDREGDNVRIVTAYFPDDLRWKPDGRTRRNQ